ncbi:hypothetical protein H4Q26_006602 [Puccinia striiformis f. sp. tritici PST-130]|nr:hypothetical protein H4Q26_006602 [Puccinia striiformis f. sp. tritici PST-130]
MRSFSLPQHEARSDQTASRRNAIEADDEDPGTTDEVIRKLASRITDTLVAGRELATRENSVRRSISKIDRESTLTKQDFPSSSLSLSIRAIAVSSHSSHSIYSSSLPHNLTYPTHYRDGPVTALRVSHKATKIKEALAVSGSMTSI